MRIGPLIDFSLENCLFCESVVRYLSNGKAIFEDTRSTDSMAGYLPNGEAIFKDIGSADSHGEYCTLVMNKFLIKFKCHIPKFVQ